MSTVCIKPVSENCGRTPKIGVVHLVRASNGIEPFERFLDSYVENPGGIRHDLLIIYKGFSGGDSIAPYEALMTGIPHRTLKVADFGYDIRAYFKAARTFFYDYFCFLNSFSVIKDKDWLKKLYDHASRQDVGLVGASGSCESAYSNSLRHELLHAFFLRRMISKIWIGFLKACFDPFPNYHIRSNGFMISRDTMHKIRPGFILSKMDAHRFESGKRGLTKQVLGRDLKALVVGKDGAVFEKEKWCRSGTFRQGNQCNLLIADNQTRIFDDADAATRRQLTEIAWGDTCDQASGCNQIS